MPAQNDILQGGDVAAIARALLGEPRRHASRGSQWRYGAKGSLCVDVTAGRFMDFETGDGGGLLRPEASGKDLADLAGAPAIPPELENLPDDLGKSGGAVVRRGG